jgi:histidinol dehydrogenase
MVKIFNIKDTTFEQNFENFLFENRNSGDDIYNSVREIINHVRADKDAALNDYTLKFDHHALDMRVTQKEIETAVKNADPIVVEALQTAHDRIKSHHQRQVPDNSYYTDSLGVELGARWTPIDAVGLYVPGGTASYPSSVLMNAIPAIVAGVPRIAMVVPSPNGVLNPLVLVTASIAGINEIYRVGGAQAVAALAYGTPTIKRVDKIVGPGNAYVAMAKYCVSRDVGIDMIAGPSEVLVIADKNNNPQWIAADLLAQAEHDTNAQSILITNDEAFAKDVENAVSDQLKKLPRQEIAQKSWEKHGAIIICRDLKEAIPLANKIAAEHLELAVADPEALLKDITNAGAVFLGKYTTEVIGDYVGGSNHVLPTNRSARFSSGLSVLEFMKRTSILKLGKQQLQALGPVAEILANIEGLEGHRRSISIRLETNE